LGDLGERGVVLVLVEAAVGVGHLGQIFRRVVGVEGDVGERVQLLGRIARRVDLVEGGVLEGVGLLDQVAALVEPILSSVALPGGLTEGKW
jgi:hypothetical protein